jgi:AcrR family transcriptional regulator
MGLRTVRALVVASLGLACLALPWAAVAQGDGGVRVATVDELLAAVAAGGLVTVEPGDYVLAETLVVGVDVELRGASPLAATLYLQGAPLGLRVEAAAHAQLVGIRLAYDADAPGDAVWVHDARLTLDGVAVGLAVGVPDAEEGAEAFGRGLVLTGAARADVLGGGLGRHERAAVEVRDGSHLHMAGALVVGNGAGIVMRDDASMTLTDTEVRDHVDFALAAHDRAVVTGGGNLFEVNGVAEDDRLISVAYVGDEASLSLSGGDVFHDNPGGAFEIAGAARVTLVDTTVEAIGTWAHTYVVEQATLLVEGGRFAGNEGGFYAGDGARIELRGVVITGGASDAIFADGHALVEVAGGRLEATPAPSSWPPPSGCSRSTTSTVSRCGRSPRRPEYAPPTVYLHFADKDDLLYHAAREGFAALRRRPRARGRGGRRPHRPAADRGDRTRVRRLRPQPSGAVPADVPAPRRPALALEPRLPAARRRLRRADRRRRGGDGHRRAGRRAPAGEVANWLWAWTHGVVALHLTMPHVDAGQALALLERACASCATASTAPPEPSPTSRPAPPRPSMNTVHQEEPR